MERHDAAPARASPNLRSCGSCGDGPGASRGMFSWHAVRATKPTPFCRSQPTLAVFPSQGWSNLVTCGSDSPEFGSTLVEFRSLPAKFGQHRSKFGRSRANLAESGRVRALFVESQPIPSSGHFGRFRALTDFMPEIGATLLEFGANYGTRCRADVWRNLPKVAELG